VTADTAQGAVYKFRFLALIPAVSASSTIRGYAGIRLWNARSGAFCLRPVSIRRVCRSDAVSAPTAALHASAARGLCCQARPARVPYGCHLHVQTSLMRVDLQYPATNNQATSHLNAGNISSECINCCLAGELVGSSMGFIQEGSITATSGNSGSCNGSYPSGPTSPRAGYPGYGPPSYAYPPVAVPAYYYPPVVRSQRMVVKPVDCRKVMQQ